MIKKLSLILLLAGAQMQAVIDINGKGVNKQALFIGACSTGNHELAKLLIEAGVNVNLEDTIGMTPLMKAVQLKHVEMVKILLNAGANANAKSSNGSYNYNNVLYFAEAGSMSPKDLEQNTAIIKLLLNAGATISEYNFQRALEVASQGNNDRLKLYLEAGYKIQQNNYNVLAVILANKLSYNDVLQENLRQFIIIMTNYGLDLNKFMNLNSCNQAQEIWLQLFRRQDVVTLPFLKFLIEAGFDCNTKTQANLTFLAFLTQSQQAELVKYLLSLKNINVDIVNDKGKTAFDIACETGNIEIIELFQNYFAAQEAKALRGNEQQATNTSVINIANNSNGQLNVLHQVEVPAHSKAEVATVISKI